ncbi:MAG: T9SS type A sorting domain-containing protein [Ignavibacteriae bacterium]|nr:T9SS type A sorting domain-containing protein [Ignavibacteriota bacterium]
MFADDATYPKLTNGTWYNKLPNFAETDVLFTTQLQTLKEFSIATVDTTYSGSLAAWRQPNNPEVDFFIYADWPTPIDLSYDDADLLTAGLGGFPVGDLAWFPAKYEEWMNQKDAEYDLIHKTLNGIVGVEKVDGLPTKFTLEQNYPNPFNPTTEINFSIPKSGNVTLKVFDAVGQEVATLVNEFKNAANYKVNFNAANLTSGVYFYRLEANDLLQTKKMLLIK